MERLVDIARSVARALDLRIGPSDPGHTFKKQLLDNMTGIC